MRAKKTKIISVSPESRERLMEKYGCSRVTLYQALRYCTHNERANAIRTDAIDNFGGIKHDKVVFN